MLDWNYIISTRTCDYPDCTRQAVCKQDAHLTPEGYIHYWCAEHDPTQIKMPQPPPAPPAPASPPIVRFNTSPLTVNQVAHMTPAEFQAAWEKRFMQQGAQQQLREQGEDWH